MLSHQFKAFICSEPILKNNFFGVDHFELTDYHPVLKEPKSKLFGKRIEELFCQNILAANFYDVILNGKQIDSNGRTIGELDFLLKDKINNKVIHVELAYKFYLFDPELDKNELNCWVGPNKNDFLHLKRDKILKKQLPLLSHSETKKILKRKGISIDKIEQRVCFIGKLYTPLGSSFEFKKINSKCIDGFWISSDNFNENKKFKNYKYYIPNKLNWHVTIKTDVSWMDFNELKFVLKQYHLAKKSPMLWVNAGNSFFKLFVTFFNDQ